MKKNFAWMQSNGNMADENFERMQSTGYTGDAKVFERIRSTGWTAGCVTCQVFLDSQRERLGTYSMHNFAITEVIRYPASRVSFDLPR